MNLAKAIQRIVDERIPVQVVTGKVTSVNEGDMTCEVEVLDGAARDEVRLRANIKDDKGVVVIPANGSFVLVGSIYNLKEQSFIMATSEVDKVLMNIDTEVAVNTPAVVFNGGNNGGLIKIDSLISRMNAVEQDLITLKTAISAAPVVPTDGGASFKAGLAAYAAAPMQITSKAQLENPEVKH